MKRLVATLSLAVALWPGFALCQSNRLPLPKPVFTAKTVIIFNNTHNEAVEQGATEALKRWGKLTVVDDPDLADITLTFDKKSAHEGTSSQKTDKDGTPSSNYSLSFSSSIHMHATLKGDSTSFYDATTTESKKKAGAECVTDLQQAYISGR
ncbi:hypothetical protein [Granulicella sibirica]|uniref:Lipoprotein n=1 Tax=Granulicella sibirica TaxID=2479048 RepID=A0A4Q0T8G6_9BACT|nr:hypothetical protein [Granulicella sibirica]RXH58016.1 hypothetical protein GRAN_1326 [Granulicella sibirica]